MDIAQGFAKGESVERELDGMISRRHDRRVAEEGERRAEEAWAESERRHAAARREENRIAWIGYFGRIAAHLRARADEYDERATRLMVRDEDEGENLSPLSLAPNGKDAA